MNDRRSLTHTPARVVLASIAAVWLTYLVITTARGVLVDLELHDEIFARRVLVTLVSMAATALVWPILRLLVRRPLWQQAGVVLLVALPASLALAMVNQLIFADIQDKVQSKIGEREGIRVRRDELGNLLIDNATAERPDDPAPAASATGTGAGASGAGVRISRAAVEQGEWRQLTELALTRYFILIAWAALYFALASGARARLAERREGDFRRAAKAAELRSLRYQVNPHFLFNTLNSLSALVLTGKAAEAETMIQTLSRFYRRSLADDPTADIALAQEIESQKLYLAVEAVRFPERLRSAIDVPAALGGVTVPGMILQPLVENSVKYAVNATTRPVTIRIAAHEDAGQLVLTVSDDGPAAGQRPQAPSTGIGLANVRDRLAARFGGAAAVTSAARAEGGWVTELRLPIAPGDD